MAAATLDLLGCILLLLVQAEVLVVAVALDPFSEALLGLKSEILDASNSLSDWKVAEDETPSSNGTISACSWTGISCNEKATVVLGLDISRKNLSGSLSGTHLKVLTHLLDLNLSGNVFSGGLPVEIPAALTNLRKLDISKNNFSGRFPDEISSIQNLVVLDALSNSFSGPLPAKAAELRRLRVLNLAGSYFEGPIPKEFGSFQSLEFLHLAGNWLGGEIPAELGSLQTVTHMEIGYNSYRGAVPWQLGNMSQLQYLDIAGANISGPLPPQLGNLTHLRSLFLFRNHLSGTIPDQIGNIISLASLDLSDNLLSGVIPESFSGLKNLTLLSLMYNDMYGTLPEGVARLPFLDSLLIWSNNFSGPLPRILGSFSRLKVLDISTNSFEGLIPSGLCSGGMLTKLMIFSNSFSGGLHPVLSNCSSLVRLRIEDNDFSGALPLHFNTLKNLTYVDVSRNRFTGGIPDDMDEAENLHYFNISQNSGLGGGIPQKLWSSLPLLHNFSASFCNISGSIPQFDSCKSISVIELSGNHLNGGIPNGISNCRDLEKLDLKRNNLTGNIPPELADLPSLSIIDLSHNGFTGGIPVKFASSSSLVLLNVSYNKISGSVPSSDAFELMGASAFAGNPNLCGSPLHRACADSKDIVHVGGLSFGNKAAGKLTLALFVLLLAVLLTMICVFMVLYTRKRHKRQWRVVSFVDFPHFTANEVLQRLKFDWDSSGAVPTPSTLYSKDVLVAGIPVTVRKIKLKGPTTAEMLNFLNQMGNSRHRNLVRLIGYCSNNEVLYLLYDCLNNGILSDKMGMKGGPSINKWEAKYKLVTGISKGLCFLHHDCFPAIPHGDVSSYNVIFDENMEPHLRGFGLKLLLLMNGRDSVPVKVSKIGSVLNSGGPVSNLEEIHRDIYSFGELLLEILTNGRLKNAGVAIQSKPEDAIIREIYDANEGGVNEESREEMKLVYEVALLCTKSMPSDRPSMEDALRRLSRVEPWRKQ